MNSVRQSGCLLRRFALKISSPCRPVHVASTLNSIYEKDEKGGYRKNLDDMPSRTEMIRDGFKQLRGEILLWKEEMREKFACDPLFIVRKGTPLIDGDHLAILLNCFCAWNLQAKLTSSGTLPTQRSTNNFFWPVTKTTEKGSVPVSWSRVLQERDCSLATWTREFPRTASLKKLASVEWELQEPE